MPATSVAMSSSLWRFTREVGDIALREDVAVSSAEVSWLISEVTESSVAFPLDAREAANKAYALARCTEQKME